MATYLQQNLHFQPCPSSTLKKSFEKVLKDVGAKKAPTTGEQSWSLGQNVIYYSTRKTKTGVTLVYKVYEEQVFSEEHAKNVRTRINDKVKEMFSSNNDSPETPCLRSEKIAAYTIGEDVEESRNLKWIWAPLIGAIFILFGILDFAGVFSSSSSKSDPNDPAYYYGTWVSNKGIIEVTFYENDVAKCKVVLGSEPIEYNTQWAVSPDNGVFWGTYYGHGEANFMTPEGHLYHYIRSGDQYKDDEVILHKK